MRPTDDRLLSYNPGGGHTDQQGYYCVATRHDVNGTFDWLALLYPFP